MRKFLIAAGAVVCLAGLWFWTAQNNARALSASISEQAQSVVAGTVHSVSAQVTGRDIRVTGMADSETERDAVISALEAIEQRGNIDNTLEILPTANPFTIAATRKNGQTLLQGNVPTEDMRAALQESGAAGADGLRLASGAPDRWESAIGAGLAALTKMEAGTVSLNGTEMRLTGIVDLPKDREALIATLELPQGFTLQNDIETRDDGTPIAYTISFDATNGLEVEGKLPKGLDPEKVGTALGVQQITGAATSGLQGDADAALSLLAQLRPDLENLENATLSFAEDTFQLNGKTRSGVDAQALQTQMITAFEGRVAVTLTPSFTVTNFTPTLQTCTTQTDQALANLKISFLSGSPNLAPESALGINALADIMNRCVRIAGLTAELGGHTDNRGTENYELSAARAQVVRTAMIERGVRGDALSAVGFGPSQPIADNATEAGREANRRLTVQWAS